MDDHSTDSLRLSVAPMIDWTDRHCRYFLRQITRRTRLYTEMIVTGAILRGDRARHLAFDPAETPLALQLGGSDPEALAACARIAEDWGYDEVNLNVGCPSDRVQSGRFGACLMAEPDLVARCVEAMRNATALPVTVKSRIAIDELEEWPTLDGFVRTVAAAGCTRFIVHARKAWLQGLSPKENREIPPLRYDIVHRLKREYPHLHVTINGGIRSLDAALEQLGHVDGVMIGRAAYETPYVLAEADRRIFGEAGAIPTRREIVERMIPYIAAERARGTPLRAITRHMLGLYQGLPGARAWRRMLSGSEVGPDSGPEVVEQALAAVERERERDAA